MLERLRRSALAGQRAIKYIAISVTKHAEEPIDGSLGSFATLELVQILLRHEGSDRRLSQVLGLA